MENTFYKTTTKTCSKCQKPFDTWVEAFDVCLDCEFPKKESVSSNPQEIVIKQAEISIKNENLSIKSTPKPVTLDEFIGQTENKKSIKTSLKIIKAIKPINIFIHGFAGCGKTTLAEIIAKELDAEFIYTIPEQLKNMETISSTINKIQSEKKLTVWMIDEAHNLDKKLINILLPILQDHKLGDVVIREFVMIFATTDYNKLHKKSEALISRFQTKVYLEKYSISEMVTILKQHKKKFGIDIDIPETDYKLIAENCKGVPREAINLLLKRLVLNDVSEIFQENKIVFNGLNKKDIQILDSLNEMKDPIGVNFLSQRVSLSEADYQLVYEPFLIESGYIQRIQRGRVISQKGKELLNYLKGV